MQCGTNLRQKSHRNLFDHLNLDNSFKVVQMPCQDKPEETKKAPGTSNLKDPDLEKKIDKLDKPMHKLVRKHIELFGPLLDKEDRIKLVTMDLELKEEFRKAPPLKSKPIFA